MPGELERTRNDVLVNPVLGHQLRGKFQRVSSLFIGEARLPPQLNQVSAILPAADATRTACFISSVLYLVHLTLRFGYVFWKSLIITCHGCEAIAQNEKVTFPGGTGGFADSCRCPCQTDRA